MKTLTFARLAASLARASSHCKPASHGKAALTLAVSSLLLHCGRFVTGVETDPSRVDPFPRQGDGAVVVIGPDASSDDVPSGDASPFEGLDGRVRRDDPRYGRLYFTRTLGGGSGNAVAAATFWRLERMPTCTVFSDGPYNFSDCPAGMQESDNEAIPRAHAGPITVSSSGTQSLTLRTNAQGAYLDGAPSDRFGLPGSSITFRAMGAEVPAFEGSVAVPRAPNFRITSDGGELRTDSEFAVSFNPSAGQNVYILVQISYSAGGQQRQASVAAYVQAREGQVVFPPRVTRRLAPAAGSMGFIYVASINATTLSAGLWPIELQAYQGEFTELTVR